MGSEMIDGLTEVIKKEVPSFRLAFKDKSWFMKLLGVLTYPFNQAFMEGYITTIGTTVYFPNEDSMRSRPDGAAATMAHEFVHMWDSKRKWLRYNIGYLSPQILFVPLLAAYAALGSWVPVASVLGAISVSYLVLWIVMKMTPEKGRDRAARNRIRKIRLAAIYVMLLVSVGGYVALAVWLSKWWAFLAVGAFVPLAPWPSPWRSHWEYRGYGMSIAWELWRNGDVSDSRLARIATRFTGMDYFRMDPNEGRVTRMLSQALSGASSGEILVGDESEPYQVVHEYLSSGGLIRANQR